MISELLVKRPTDTNYTAIDLSDDIPYSVTYSVGDIRNPENRSGSYSKTVNVPGTKINNALFEFIFNVNSALQTFNPNLKCDAILRQDGIEIFKGNLRLANIYSTDKDSISYDVELYGQVKGLFDAVSNKQLTALDLSAFNHLRTFSNISNSWTAGQANGYVYPLISNGYGNMNAPVPTFITSTMFPCFYAKTILDEIFKEAGFTYSSTFFNSAFFKKLIIPSKGTVVAHNVNMTLALDIAPLQQSTSGGGYVPVNAGTVGGLVQIVSHNTATNVTNILGSISVYGVGYLSSISLTGVQLVDGDQVYCRVVNQLAQSLKITINSATWAVTYSDGSGTFSGFITAPQTVIVGGTPYSILYTSEIDPNGVFNLTTHTVPFVGMQNYLPDKVLQKDFIIGLIRMFNLYFEVDKNQSNNILIEPRNDYYAAGATKDWTRKWAVDRELQSTPMGELDTRQFNFQFTPAKDFYNHLYTDGDQINTQPYAGWGEVYGQYIRYVTNDFQTNIKTIQPVFSPSVMYSLGATNIVTPVYMTADPFTVPTPNNYTDSGVIRILYYGGLKNCSQWQMQDLLGNAATYTQYPYAGHLDDIQAPTLDINYGIPKQVFYSMSNPSLFTDNNLFNKYWGDAITEITDKDSKIVTGWFYLTPADIQLLDFRDTIKVDEQYYHINKIIEYSPTVTDLTKVELTKLNKAVVFVPGNGVIIATQAGHGVIFNGNNTNTNVNVVTPGKVIGEIPKLYAGGKNAYEAVNSKILIG